MAFTLGDGERGDTIALCDVNEAEGVLPCCNPRRLSCRETTPEGGGDGNDWDALSLGDGDDRAGDPVLCSTILDRLGDVLAAGCDGVGVDGVDGDAETKTAGSSSALSIPVTSSGSWATWRITNFPFISSSVRPYNSYQKRTSFGLGNRTPISASESRRAGSSSEGS